jgi:hypothetical protein
VVADGESLQIPQALASTQDSKHGHQQQIPSGKPNPAPHPRIGDRTQIADQVEIGCSGGAFKHKEGAIPPTSTHADSTDKRAVTDFESALPTCMTSTALVMVSAEINTFQWLILVQLIKLLQMT